MSTTATKAEVAALRADVQTWTSSVTNANAQLAKLDERLVKIESHRDRDIADLTPTSWKPAYGHMLKLVYPTSPSSGYIRFWADDGQPVDFLFNDPAGSVMDEFGHMAPAGDEWYLFGFDTDHNHPVGYITHVYLTRNPDIQARDADTAWGRMQPPQR
jgi:hypothetical protein